MAFKLAQGLIDDRPFLESLLDLVALGTVADMASLTGENRILSRLGLAELDKRERPGIHALCEAAGQKMRHPSTDTPSLLNWDPVSTQPEEWIPQTKRLNSSSQNLRMSQLGSPPSSIKQIRNDKILEKHIQDQAIEIIENEIDDETVGIVVASDKWDEKAKGVVGIVAGRLKETYYKPAIVLAINGDQATGSGRCIESERMNLADSLVACTDLLVGHGGHAAAAGLTIKPKYSQIQEIF